jgi:hypothetical protein
MQEIDLGKQSFSPGDSNNPVNAEPSISPEETDTATVDSQSTINTGNSEEKGERFSPREKHLYERLKKTEAKLKEKGISMDEGRPQTGESANPFNLAKSVAVLRDFDSSEIDFAEKIARMDNISAEQAVQSSEFKTWLKGKRDEDLKANRIPAPNSSSASYGLPDGEAIGKMSKTEHAKFEKDFLAKQRNKGSGF